MSTNNMPHQPETKEISARRADLIQVHDHCVEQPYVELLIPQDCHTVTEVVFTAVAKDQGWADRNDGPSYTWFDAAVRRGPGRSAFRRINVINNDLAGSDFAEHRHSFNLESRGRRSTWVQGLRPGDTVQMIPKAKYIAWVNIVKECHITLKYTVADAQSSLSSQLELTEETNAGHYTRQLNSKDGEIRLVVVKPGKMEDPVQCAWETVRLADDPEFCALSYCWGTDQRDSVDIAIQSDTAQRSFRIGKSVEEAIRRLRHTDKPLRIWIDAMCINQNDMEERSQQVALMRSIYTRAEKVHIWLGEGEPAVATCLRIIRDICNFNTRTCPGGAKCSCPGTKHKIALEEIDADLETKNGSHSFKAMHEVFHRSKEAFTEDDYDWAGGRYSAELLVMMTTLFSNAWFKRVWVVQEATLARHALVHSSGETIPWNEVVSVSEWLESPDFTIHNQHVQAQTLMAPIWRTIQESHVQQRQHEEEASDAESDTESLSSCDRHQHHDVLDIFLGGHDLQASDPRDKIFALLSFGRETSAIQQLDTLVQPDYEKPTDQVFADFTRWWIREHKSLAILSTIHSQLGRTWQKTVHDSHVSVKAETQPTWAVDSQGQSRWAKASLQAQFNFHAAGDSSPDLTLLDTPAKPLTLRLRGRQVSHITALSHAPIEAIYPYRKEPSERGDLESVFHKILDPCGVTGFWGIKSIKDEGEDTRINGQNEYADHVRAHWGYATRPRLQAILPTNNTPGETRWYETDKVPTCFERCFFVTAQGDYGLCPWMAREGDVVVVLDGGDVPYLLRRRDEATAEAEDCLFEFIGECFVDGIMHGEYLKGGSAGETRVFDLV